MRPAIVVVLAAMLVALVAGEVALRVVLFSGRWLRTAANLVQYVADPYVDDSFHRLFLHLKLRGREHDRVYDTFDPALGWIARPRTPDNPLGILTPAPYTLEELRGDRTMLVLGDSFVAGVTAVNDAFPAQLGRLMPGWKVLNLGVPAYGLDQVYLLLRATAGRFDHPHVVVGIFYNDVDRLIHEVGPSPKPYFAVENGALIERGTPIPADYSAWLASFPLPRQSYLLQVPRGLLRRLLVTPWATEHLFFLHPSETTARRGEKEALTRAVVRAIRDECVHRGLPLTVVLFPYREHLVHEGWYGVFLRDVLEQERIGYLDLTPALRERVAERHTRWSSDVYTFFEHPSPEENAFIAARLAGYLRETHGY